MEHTHQLCAIIWGAESSTYHQELLREHASELTSGVRDGLENGNFITGPMYVKAQQARTKIRESFLRSLKEADVLITPTSPVTAPKVSQTTVVIGEKEELLKNHSSRLTRPLNLAGLPACSVPCGFTKDGLPIGLQIIGRPFDESMVLRVAYAYEQATEWHLRRPPI
jgi:aspartyl-tRNA(Asn)/glutamyl-tRNA(Gln) amidotransferase subunit A